MLKKIAVLTLLVALILVSSCSSSSKKSSTTTSLPRDVTTEQSQLLSRALSNNAEDKNATFNAVSGQFGAGGFGAIGKVNWVDSIVETEVALIDPARIDIRSSTTKDGVFESFTDLETGMNDAGLEPRDWVFRAFDPGKYGIDALSQFIAKLSAPTPDNPILLKQNGAQYLGTEKVENVLTYKFQNSTSVTYFLTKQGELKKVIARIKGFNNDVSIVFNDRSTTEIVLPLSSDSYPIEKVSTFYTQLRPPF